MRQVYGQLQSLYALCIAPHPDDAEIGAGGTLIRLAEADKAVGILELSLGEMGTLGTPEERLQEAKNAAEIMGLAWRGNLEFPDGGIRAERDQVLKLARVLRQVRPEVLFIPHPLDRHPDHVGSHQLCKEAVHVAGLRKADLKESPHKVRRVLLYQGNFPMEASVLVDTSNVQEKWEKCVMAHTSQFTGPAISETVSPEVVDRRRARNMYWGTFAGVKYAEAFASETPLLLDPTTL
ncbi:bacillithiol biosynthesis deacetylase BshB1 [Deinococcus cellulosilyticus]|uniref:Bacillithiol biosynthesis deacetylase BshB1 n=1 Tax=Deinococcus cellulosilyticus (strain DSM 18568 / NBRC 106333 / KACC 11606 / 5516J-15) TaxID=1223518 RepID=A0A511N6N8_DEIC1|nr:bacillithiol biosynthesis deacetylase BshB1 [Deinococcus cellulosilyticus]GEM48071.1 hypothetical protein DC3_37060 [Deinococcus cellulosilyticus NBRC 106333 = KACC 11606]